MGRVKGMRMRKNPPSQLTLDSQLTTHYPQHTMLPKQHRLPLRTDLVRVQEEGELFQGRLFSLLVAKGEKAKPSRFAFIISTKIHKRAVKRNRARRLLVEAIRSLLAKIKPGFDCVFLAKKPIIGKGPKEIKLETETLFRKARLIP